MSNFWVMITLIFAGQTLGSLLGLIKKPSKKLLQSSLAFAAAMMMGISIINLIPEALMFSTAPLVALFFILGFFILKLVDKMLPHIHPEFFSKECDSMKKNMFMLSSYGINIFLTFLFLSIIALATEPVGSTS